MSLFDSQSRARQMAEGMMNSTCRIFDEGEPVTDPDTGAVVRPVTDLWTGKCRIRPSITGLTALADALGGGETFRFDYRVSIPFEVSNIVEGHRLEILTSADPALRGLIMEVQRVDRGDNITARRLICQRIG